MSGKSLDPYFDGILPTVEKPSRYIGNELNFLSEGFTEGRFNILLAFPDVYEIGMSYQGIHTLYRRILQKRLAEVEFIFAPWPDMEKRLLDCDERLRSLQSGTPAGRFDLVGFSLTYELHYTNLLMMLRLAGIPFEASERTDKDPLVIAGGACCMNPLPVIKSMDAVFLGDGEESLLEAVELLKELKGSKAPREDRKEALSGIDGVYVEGYSSGAGARIYSLHSDDDKKFDPPYKLPGIVPSWKPLVPSSEIVHERLVIEVQRGCTRGCRFCQAGMLYRPCRERGIDGIVRAVIEGLDSSGWEEVSLLSLSTSDYSKLGELVEKLAPELRRRNVSLALPSLRPETITDKIVEALSLGKKSGFTIAPEAGTERLRRVINRDMSNGDIIGSCRRIIEGGWRTIKLYFMIGLPTETKADLDGIVDLINEILSLKKKGKFKLNVTVSPFVPKAHTPFQREKQCGTLEIAEKQEYLSSRLRDRRLNLRLRNPEVSVLEGILARGDSSLWPVLLRVVERGGRFEGWSDYFNFDIWKEELDEKGMNLHNLLSGIPSGNPLPWEKFRSPVKREFLIEERERGYEGMLTPDCREGLCTDCGVCDYLPGEGYDVSEKKQRSLNDTEKPESIENSKSAEDYLSLKTGGELDKADINADSENNQEAVFRYRFIFSKTGKARFISHREIVDVIRRAVRRTGLPVNLSKGFHPQIKLSIAPPLSVGMEGENEFFDIELKDRMDISPEVFHQLLPPGIEVKRCTGPFTKKKGKLPVESLFHYHLDFEALRFLMKDYRKDSKYLRQGFNMWYLLKESLSFPGDESVVNGCLADNPAECLLKRFEELFGRNEDIINRRGKTRSLEGCRAEFVGDDVIGLKLPAEGGAGVTPRDLLSVYLPDKFADLVRITRKGLYYIEGGKSYDPAELIEKR
ncbi:MAG: TIGR03960 family B12-binding radical SAM protein [Candidatus Krumholzibacteriota bacterium]|nr:TIGR03960 family B12-binding radical SAM protein [Candidatus Krumholzibacteriota bacterium]